MTLRRTSRIHDGQDGEGDDAAEPDPHERAGTPTREIRMAQDEQHEGDDRQHEGQAVQPLHGLTSRVQLLLRGHHELPGLVDPLAVHGQLDPPLLQPGVQVLHRRAEVEHGLLGLGRYHLALQEVDHLGVGDAVGST